MFEWLWDGVILGFFSDAPLNFPARVDTLRPLNHDSISYRYDFSSKLKFTRLSSSISNDIFLFSLRLEMPMQIRSCFSTQVVYGSETKWKESDQ